MQKPGRLIEGLGAREGVSRGVGGGNSAGLPAELAHGLPDGARRTHEAN